MPAIASAPAAVSSSDQAASKTIGLGPADWAALRKGLLGTVAQSLLPPHVALPVLPEALARFNREASLPTATAAGLGTIVDSDTALTCELLKVVNSAAIGLRNRVRTGAQAVALLGIKRTQLLLISTAVQTQAAGQTSPLMHARLFARANLERGTFARVLAGQLGTDADLAFAAGLIQDFLLPLLTREMTSVYFDLMGRLSVGSCLNLATLEQTALGWTHAEAAARVMVAWGFPDDLACCVALHHSAEVVVTDPVLRRTSAVAAVLAGCLPDRINQTPDGVARLIAYAAELGFDLGHAARESDRLMADLAPSASEAPLVERLGLAA